MKMKFLLIGTAILLFPVFLHGQLVQWRGEARTGIYPDQGLLKEWPENGPDLALEIKGFGEGHSSPVKWNNMLFITGMIDTLDVLSVYDMKGKMLWRKTVGRAWNSSFPDSRNTPTIKDGRLYIASGMGEIVCFDAKTGSEYWRVNPQEKYKGRFGTWGYAESLLLMGNSSLLCSVGGDEAAFVALDTQDGHEIWRSVITDDKRAYSSPILIERGGHRIVIAELSSHVYGINPDDGTFYWSYDLLKDLVKAGGRRNSTNTPTYRDGKIFLTAGYDATALMLNLSEDGLSVSKAWTTDVLDNHFGGTVTIDGFIYGSNWISNGKGNWVCLDWQTGKVMYETTWFNKGPVISADAYLYIMEEKNGQMALVKASPDSFTVISSFTPIDEKGPFWAHPAIFDGQLYVRHGSTLKVFNLRED